MADAVFSRYAESDVVVMAAAVADFRPKAIAPEKLKKQAGVPEVVLEPTPDILAGLGERKTHQVLVGFAAETEQVIEHARAKVAAKNLDLIVANDVSAPDQGFEVDTNRGILIESSGFVGETPLVSKVELAGLILDRITGMLAPERAEQEEQQ